LWRSRDKAIIEGVKFVYIPLILVAYNGVSAERYTSEEGSVAEESGAPQKVNEARPGTLITDAFRKSRTRNKSPGRGSVRLYLDNNALWVGRTIMSRTGLYI
jgi:hypothetical protein